MVVTWSTYLMGNDGVLYFGLLLLPTTRQHVSAQPRAHRAQPRCIQGNVCRLRVNLVTRLLAPNPFVLLG